MNELSESIFTLTKKIKEYQKRIFDDNSKIKFEYSDSFVQSFTNKWKHYFDNIPESITKQSISYKDYFIRSGLFVWDRLFYSVDINWSESPIDIIEEKLDDYFSLPIKTIEWFKNAQYGDFDRIVTFDKTKPERRLLFKRAMDLYKDENLSNRKSTYTYKRALEDANDKFKIIPNEEFDVDFYNIEQGFKTWRKK